MQIGNRFAVTVQLQAIETLDFLQQRCHATPLVQQRQCLRELHLAIEFDKTDYITTATAAIAVEQALTGIDKEAWFMIGMQRTQSHQSTTAETPGRLPIMTLQIVQQSLLSKTVVESEIGEGALL